MLICCLTWKRAFDVGRDFLDHPRKRVVREQWDTPILRALYEVWGKKYFYVGLPGPAAIDIELWRDMISRVVAFEMECQHAENPRKNIISLNRKLTLLNIPSSVYCGSLEEVVIWGKDIDRKEFHLDEFVTLYNLDFCNSITGRITTADGRHRCLRFEALREIVALQRTLYRQTGAGRFVLLITAFDSFHARDMKRFLSSDDLSPDVRAHCKAALGKRRLARLPVITGQTQLLRMFVFVCLRDYFRGQNVESWFLPPVSYLGRSESSPMVHFTVICSMGEMESAQVVDRQRARDFIKRGIVQANEQGLFPEVAATGSDPVAIVRDSLASQQNGSQILFPKSSSK